VREAVAAPGRRRLPRPALALRMPGPRLRLRLIILVLVCLALAAGYQFWLRDSSLVAVDDVQVRGLTTKDAERVRAALTSAGQTMTTLNVDHELLHETVAHYPSVNRLEVSTDFPHGLVIRVIEHHPAALVELGGDRVPVAGDGTILRGMPVEGRLPVIDTEVRARGERLSGSAALHAAGVAGAAPAILRSRVEAITARKEDGIVVELHEGPELIFGDATRVRAKWIAAVRVLADPESAGATYIDVSLPGRPAAGGLPAETLAPVAPAGSSELAAPSEAAPADPGVDPATEQLAPAAPASGEEAPPPAAAAPGTTADPGTAPAEPEQGPAPTDSTGAGGVSPPPE
jgi:cell division protein FtsQ